ncbi:hypothetical protein AJ78_06493 [Emergomyces pasteurianus Ep9510]|uniref:non-specific serine/threonine protein kinase n=1 Tax=Emergomyces pasteurianus Ep9510 TaxID=1447872 RepID=A0A1J9P930_9EURO|nr:hypothetical protein AJ78_06493 [Emergomyces pasteurianus Ep9510]
MSGLDSNDLEGSEPENFEPEIGVRAILLSTIAPSVIVELLIKSQPSLLNTAFNKDPLTLKRQRPMRIKQEIKQSVKKQARSSLPQVNEPVGRCVPRASNINITSAKAASQGHIALSRVTDMAELSPDEDAIIKNHVLTDSLNHLHDRLRDAESIFESRLVSYDGAVDDLDQLYRKAISSLLYILQGEDAALNLRSRISDQNVDLDLADLYKHLRKGKGNFRYDHYRPLIRLVIQRPSTETGDVGKWNIDVWKAVFTLISTVSRTTPPATVPPSFHGTPVRFTSSSQRGSEQTRELVEAKIFEEIQDCTHRDVEGFFAKYFEGRAWSEQADVISRRVLDSQNDGSWAQFPKPPTEHDVRSWWFRFQDEFLLDARGVYFSTKSKSELVGSDADRQVDLLLKARSAPDRQGKHDWRDIRVVGELKKPENEIKTKATLLQMGRYVREVFKAQPTRRFVHAFAVCGTKAEAWVFDRSGLYSSGSFDVCEHQERFFQMIVGYAMMSDDELGLDTFMTRSGGGNNMITVERAGGGETTVRLDPNPLSVQYAIVCRGTACFLAEADEGVQAVAKFSWVSDKRALEKDLLNKACERGVRGVAKIIGHQRITDIAELRSGLTFGQRHHFPRTAPSSAASSFSLPQSGDSRSRSCSQLRGLSIGGKKTGRKRRSSDKATQPFKRSRSSSQLSEKGKENELAFSVQSMHRPSLYDKHDELYNNRILRCLVISPVGRPIYEYESPLELLKALCDAIKAHRSLYLKGNILHRDISENNIIITDPEKADGNFGMLIDLDLAKEVGSGRSGARHQTGTREFMAIEVLLNVDHTYRHDLESFFYVLIWQCARHGWKRSNRGKEKPKKCLLTEWYTGGYDQIANAKRGRMDVNGFEDVLLEFPPEFNCVKPLCRELREDLFPYCRGLFVGTPVKSEILYDPIIQAFHKAIEDIEK